MTSAVETEIKFQVNDVRLLTAKLQGAGLRLITPRTHEMNTLYDLPGRPLRKKGALLRVRKYGNRWTITFKGRAIASRHKSRMEIETAVEDGQSMMEILEGSGFLPRFQYEKFRSEWNAENAHVLIDETPIGDFCEIEGSGAWIDSVADQLGISSDQYITDSYAVLFLKWKRQTGSKAKNMTFAEVRGRK